MLAFIAHFFHFSKSEIYEMTIKEVIDWFDAGYNLYSKMYKENNKKPKLPKV